MDDGGRVGTGGTGRRARAGRTGGDVGAVEGAVEPGAGRVARVRVRGRETAYRRAGRGPRVVLLTEGQEDPPGDPGLFARLALDHGVVQPLRTPGPVGPGDEGGGPEVLWLCDFLEGLGGEPPILMLDRAWDLVLQPGREALDGRTSAWVLVEPEPA